jgi:hypothetical protein
MVTGAAAAMDLRRLRRESLGMGMSERIIAAATEILKATWGPWARALATS